MLSSISFGFGSYINGEIGLNPWLQSLILGLTQGIVCFCYWAWTRHRIFPKDATKTTKLLTLLCGVLLGSSQISLLVAYDRANRQKINIGVVQVFGGATAIFGLFGSFCIYKEAVHFVETLGCLMTIGGLTLIGLSEGTQTDLILVICAIYPFFGLGIKQVLAKHVCKLISVTSFNLVCFGITCLTSIIIGIFWQANVLSVETSNASVSKVILQVIGSSLSLVGLVTMYYSIAHGTIGIAVAICNTAILVPTLLSWFVDNHDLDDLELAGVALSLVGVIIMCTWKDLQRRTCPQKEIELASPLSINGDPKV